MVQTMVQKYLVLRGSIYHFRYALPQDIRLIYPHLPREIKRSLRTDSLVVATTLVSQKLPFIKALQNNLIDPDVRISQIDSLTFRISANIPNSINSIPQKMRFSDAWDSFVKWKKWTEKQSKANQRMFENIKLFVGDRFIQDINKRTLKEALTSIQTLPKRNQYPYRQLSLLEISKMTIPEDDRVSTKYVKDHLKLCQSLFGRYLRDELDIIAKSPTEGLIYDHQQIRFAALTDEQVFRLVNMLEQKPIWFKWLVLLALYTGARRSELINLVKSDFKSCPATGRHYFEIRAGKTRAAQREVPITNQLIKVGFITWLVTLQEGRLFNVTANRATDLFNSTISTKKNFHGERIVFHSLRHTFITKARAAGISDVLVQQVVGHEKRGAGQTDRYTHHFALQDTFKVVDVIHYRT